MPFWRDRQDMFLPHAHLQCGSAPEPMLLVSSPKSQISSASSSSHILHMAAQSHLNLIVVRHKMSVEKEH